MLTQTLINEDLDFFEQTERLGVQRAKDFYALASENFDAIDQDGSGCLTLNEIVEYSGNQKLRDFLFENKDCLAALSFNAEGLSDLIKEAISSKEESYCISFSDLNTFSWFCDQRNRRHFYEGNFQGLREDAGLNAAATAFVLGILMGWLLLALVFTRMNLLLSPAESIAVGVLATVGIPLAAAMLGYSFGTRSADIYFQVRVEKADRILEVLEKTP
ncbi:MAG: hypothetical protein K2X27_22235 [Candidatus Obscuribacterales bacterium]|nr:hypothetical protein [Candidatus Obscuribacterales bacterium]